MHQGLIAQWYRGIASKGFIGALLLTVPVLVAATIGVGGGVGGGLSSLATGPSDTAVGGADVDVSQTRAIDRLTETLPSLTIESARRSDGSGGGSTETEETTVIEVGGETPIAGAPEGDSPTGGGGGGSGGGGGGAPATDPPPADPPPPPADDPSGIGVGINNGLTQLVQGLGLSQ